MTPNQQRIAIVLAALLLLVLFLFWWFRPVAVEGPVPAIAPVTGGPARKTRLPVLPPTKRDARLSRPYDFRVIEMHLRRDRRDFALCFLQQSGATPAKMTMTIRWDGNGHLTDLKVVPEISPESSRCLSELIRQWPVEPHPALKPFSFTKPLVLSGP